MRPVMPPAQLFFANHGVTIAIIGIKRIVSGIASRAGNGNHHVIIAVEFNLQNTANIAVHQRQDSGVHKPIIGERGEGVIGNADSIKVVGEIHHTCDEASALPCKVLHQRHFREYSFMRPHRVSMQAGSRGIGFSEKRIALCGFTIQPP